MSEEVYVTALKNTLTEIKNISPNIKHSFIFTEDGTIIAGDEDIENISLKKTMHFFQHLVGKADTIGGLNSLAINAEKGKLHISRVNNMYLAVTTSDCCPYPPKVHALTTIRCRQHHRIICWRQCTNRSRTSNGMVQHF